MLSLSQASWVRALVVISVATFLVRLLHTADDLIQEDYLGGLDIEALVVTFVLINTLSVFGILWTWAGKWYGYAIVGVISLLSFYGLYLSHLLKISDARGFDEMAQATPELWALTFVATSLPGSITSLAAVIIAVYLLLRARQGAGA